MNTYLLLSYLIAGALVVPLVNAAKKRELTRFQTFLAVAGFSLAISILVVLYIYHYVDPMTAATTTAWVFLLSQVVYQVVLVVAKWATQKEPVTTKEVISDTETVISQVEGDVKAVEATPTPAAI